MIAVISYVQADRDIGMGHVVRLQAMQEALLFQYDNILIGAGDRIPDFFKRGAVYDITSNIREIVNRALASHEFVFLFVDHPAVPRSLWDIEDDRLIKVAIDDVGSDILRCDVVINCSAVGQYHYYPSLSTGAVQLLGLDYLPLRREFADAGSLPRPNDNSKSVGFVVGSSNIAEKLVYTILSVDFAGNDWCDVQMVVSSTMSSFPKVESIGREKKVLVRTGLDSREMAAFYRQFDVCVVTAGMALYEAMAAGGAVVAIPLLSDMKPETAYLASQGCLVSLLADTDDAHTLTATVNALLNDRQQIDVLRQTARKTVDGRGVERIADVLGELAESCLVGTSKQAALRHVKEKYKQGST